MVLTTRERILRYLRRERAATGPELAKHLGITRQAVNKHLRTLIIEGELEKRGSTRSTIYSPPASREQTLRPRSARKICILAGLAEDRAFDELAQTLLLARSLSRSALTILRYGFTEILNNAIDHSRSERCSVEIILDPYDCHFAIRDFGIGIFHSIRAKFRLSDEATALGLLLKGKTTTMKERHSGEGIFFVSKAADHLSIRSHKSVLVFDNRIRNTVVQEARFLRGTDVRFTIKRRSRRSLAATFREYAPEEFDLQFQRTRVLVKLHLQEYVSRSEAKRLLVGLERFKEILLDFTSVRTIGQGFADEVFRVFPAEHSGIAVRAENAPPAVLAMIRHVAGGRQG